MHSTIVVLGFEDDDYEELQIANAEAVKRFGESRVSKILRPVDGHIGHASFYVSPSGIKNDDNNDLREYSRWLRNKRGEGGWYLDFVRVRFGEGTEPQILDRPDILTHELRCEHCGSFAVKRDPCWEEPTKAYRLYCNDCCQYGDKVRLDVPLEKENPYKKQLAQAVNDFMKLAPEGANGGKIQIKTDTGARYAVSVNWMRLP